MIQTIVATVGIMCCLMSPIAQKKEVCIGTVTTQQGDGQVLNAPNQHNYISYRNMGEMPKGTMIMTHLTYDSANDVIDRKDFVLPGIICERIEDNVATIEVSRGNQILGFFHMPLLSETDRTAKGIITAKEKIKKSFTLVTIETTDGHSWQIENYDGMVGDEVTVVFDDRGTEEVQDDIIKEVI